MTSRHLSHGPVEPGDARGSHLAPELDRPYLACARKLGFDPSFAQVIVDAADKPSGAKTGREVPADVHSPCLVRLGGDDPSSSSYGNP